jgi:hypothetical protein
MSHPTQPCPDETEKFTNFQRDGEIKFDKLNMPACAYSQELHRQHVMSNGTVGERLDRQLTRLFQFVRGKAREREERQA